MRWGAPRPRVVSDAQRALIKAEYEGGTPLKVIAFRVGTPLHNVKNIVCQLRDAGEVGYRYPFCRNRLSAGTETQSPL